MRYKNQPIERRLPRGQLSYSQRYEICELALEMGLSEAQFYRRFAPDERAQLLATWRTRKKIQALTV